MNKLLWAIAISFVFIFIVGVVRWAFLSNVKIALEVEFYQTAIEYMKRGKDANQ